MKIVRTLSLAAIMALILTFAVSAASWEYIYEGDKLPDAGEWEIFKAEMVGDVCEITPDGELHMTDTDSTVCFLQIPAEDLEKATVEVRVKVLSQSGSAYTVFFGIEDGAVYTWVHLFPDRVELEGNGDHFLDMTEYHIVRIARDENDATVYVDDEAVIDGMPVGSGDRMCIIFGSGSTGGTGEHYWDYVAFTTAGAFSPAELPNYYISTQAVDSEGKVAVYWGTIKSQ